MLITYYKIENKKLNKNNASTQKKNREEREKRKQLNSIVVCFTKASHSPIYRTYHSISYIMEFNERMLQYELYENCNLCMDIHIYNMTLYL